MDRVPLLGDKWNWGEKNSEQTPQQNGGLKVRPNRRDVPSPGQPDTPEHPVLTPYEYPSSDSLKRADRYYDTPKMYRYYTSSPVREGRDRRNSSFVAKLFVFSMMMISFLVLMYIPVYNKATRKTVTLAGWSAESNRDTKVYIQPGNITLLHDVKSICSETTQSNEKVYLLIMVFSATANFKERQVIRETWANYSQYTAMVDTYNTLMNRYSNYTFDYDLPIDESTSIEEYFDSDNGVKSQNVAKTDLDNDAHIAAVSVKGNSNINFKENIRAKITSLNANTNVKSVESNLDENSHINEHSVGKSLNKIRRKRSLVDVMPDLVAAMKKEANAQKKDEPEEQRFDEDKEDKLLPEFQMDKVLGNNAENDEQPAEYDDEPSNVMKIPPRGFEDSPNIETVIKLLKDSDFVKPSDSKPNKDNNLDSNKDKEEYDEVPSYEEDKTNKLPAFKLVFLLGLPSGENETEVQGQIDREAMKHGDIIQESFVDSYNNLTLKSIMMLKWVVTHCEKRVHYVLKTDDDVFMNVPRLVRRLRERTVEHYQAKAVWGVGPPEYYVMGYLIRNARPVTDVNNKWYNPPYMYRGRIYPRYLSGTGYVLTETAVGPLYRAALKTPFFHLEDVFITGMCAIGAVPRLRPEADHAFKATCCADLCDLFDHTHAHRVSEAYMRDMVKKLSDASALDTCIRRQLNTKRSDMLARASGNNDYVFQNRMERLSKVKQVYTVRKVRY